MEYRTHRINVPNTGAEGEHELVFYDFGDPDALLTTICVHGLTRNAHDFDVLATELSKRKRRVLSISMAGRGESAWLSDTSQYHYGTYVADCLAVMDNFHLRGVEWIGTSMGGIIGMMIAASQPDRIRRLVLNDIGTFLSKEALQRIYGYVSALPSKFESRASAEAFLAEAFKPFGITDPALWQLFLKNSLIERNGEIYYACDPAIIEPVRRDTKNFTELNDVNLAAFWEKIDIPTLIIRGEISDVLDAETVSAMRSTNMKAETVTIPQVGHAPALVSQEQVKIVADWLQDRRGLIGL